MHNILLIYIEPTPYILRLIDLLMLEKPGSIQTLFLYENLSQKWDLSIKNYHQILPKNIFIKILLIIKFTLNDKYKIIHTAGWSNLWILFIIFIAKYKKKIITIESDTPSHYSSLFKRLLKTLIYTKLFKLVNLFFVGGIKQGKYIELYKVKKQNIIPINMTVDIIKIQHYSRKFTRKDALFSRLQFNIPTQHILFLFVGRLEKIKGITYLLSVFNKIKNDNISLLVIGDGSLRKQVEHAANTNEHIYYGGRCANKILFNIYYAADVIILPSHYEPWGLVINEAMAFGKPVITTTNVGCVNDLVSHLETGYIIKPGCINSLHQAINYMINNPLKRVLMKKNALKKIASWSLENQAKKMHYYWKNMLC